MTFPHFYLHGFEKPIRLPLVDCASQKIYQDGDESIMEATIAVPEPEYTDRQLVTGLSITEARDLLDWLENHGITTVEVSQNEVDQSTFQICWCGTPTSRKRN